MSDLEGVNINGANVLVRTGEHTWAIGEPVPLSAVPVLHDPEAATIADRLRAERNATVSDIPDAELLRRAVWSCRGKPRWRGVSDTFLLGSIYAAQLCRRFGLDPDEMVRR